MSVSNLVWKTAKWGAIALVGGPVLVVLLVATGPLLSNAPSHIQKTQPAKHFENNYRTGTEGYVLTELAHEAFPYMDILISDQRFQDQMTEASKGAHPPDAMMLLHRVGQNHLNRVSALQPTYFMVHGGMAWENEFINLSACVVYLSPNGRARGLSKEMATVLHEAIHCSRAMMFPKHSEAAVLDFFKVIQKMPSFRDPTSLTDTLIRHITLVIEEAFVTASERSLSFKPGPVGELARAAYQREIDSARLGSPVNESPHVAILVERLCAKAGDCPTDTPSLSAFLLSRDEYSAALEQDILRWVEIRR